MGLYTNEEMDYDMICEREKDKENEKERGDENHARNVPFLVFDRNFATLDDLIVQMVRTYLIRHNKYA